MVTSEIDERGGERGWQGHLRISHGRSLTQGQRCVPNARDYPVLAGVGSLLIGTEVLHKASSEEEAIQQLARLSGGAQAAFSSFDGLCDGEIVFHCRNVSSVTVQLLPLTRGRPGSLCARQAAGCWKPSAAAEKSGPRRPTSVKVAEGDFHCRRALRLILASFAAKATSAAGKGAS